MASSPLPPSDLVPTPPESLSVDLRLEHQLCFALYAAMNRVSRLYIEALEPLGITFSQLLSLLVLWERSPRSVKEIGQALGSTFSTMSPLLQRLEIGGFVRRVRDIEDERRVWVHITDKGLNLRQPVIEVRKVLAGKLRMTDEELIALRKHLQRLSSHIDDAALATGAARLS